jgi:hypothetical protein
MHSASEIPNIKNLSLARLGDALPPPGAASRFAIQEPLSARAADQPVGPDPAKYSAHVSDHRTVLEAEIGKLSQLVWYMDSQLEALTETGGGDLPKAAEYRVMRDDTRALIAKYQADLTALNAPTARESSAHEHKGPDQEPVACSAEDAILPSDDLMVLNAQLKEQKKIQKKAARQALKSEPMQPADRVRKAETSNRPEVTSLVNFIVDHFEGRLLPLTDNTWRVIPQWAGFMNLHTDAQKLARDFGELTADQRNVTAIMNLVHDRRHELAARASARPKKAEQKDPGPRRQGAGKADKPVVVPVQPLVVHLPDVKPQEPVLEQPEQQQLTPLENLLRQEAGKPKEVDLLAAFIVNNGLKNAGQVRELQTMRLWPGFEELDRNVKRLGDTFLKVPDEERAKSQIHQKILMLRAKNNSSLVREASGELPITLTERLAQCQALRQRLKKITEGRFDAIEQLETTTSAISMAAAQKALNTFRASPQYASMPLETLRGTPFFRKLIPVQQRFVEVHAEVAQAQLAQKANEGEMDAILQKVPAQEKLLVALCEKFTDALKMSPSATAAMKEFLRDSPFPDDANGELHASLPGAEALGPDVMALLRLADELTTHARLCGELWDEESKTYMAHTRPRSLPLRYVHLREMLVGGISARQKASVLALSMKLLERNQPGAIAELDGLAKVQAWASPEPSAMDYSEMEGFARLSRSAQSLGRSRDEHKSAEQRLNQMSALVRSTLLGID